MSCTARSEMALLLLSVTAVAYSKKMPELAEAVDDLIDKFKLKSNPESAERSHLKLV